MKHDLVRLLSAAILLLAVGIAGLRAGDLNPPGPPVSGTMKTLDEVQPRIPIHMSDLPMTITSPGAYYLTEDGGPFDGAIVILADNVSLDLMGYSLFGSGGGSQSGIRIGDGLTPRRNVEIRNGTVRNFGGSGVNGVYFGEDRGHRVVNLRALNNGNNGIRLCGQGHYVAQCTVIGNAGDGIRVEHGCTLLNNTVRECGYWGIIVEGEGCTLQNNTASDCYGAGFWAAGSTLIGNTAYENLVGIIASQCTLIHNTCNENSETGIKAYGSCQVIENLCYNNGSWTEDSGLYIDGWGNRVENNLVFYNYDINIRVTGSHNLLIKNLAGGSSTNYDIAPDNAYGPLVNIAGGGVITSTSPWANFY